MALTHSMRLLVAAHELFHGLVWHHAGLDRVELSIDRHGNGRAVLLGRTVYDEDGLYWYAVGSLAGPEGDREWALRHDGVSVETDCYRDDWAAYRRQKNHPLGAGLVDHQVLREARRQVVELWPEVVRLAPRLVDRGEMRL